MNSVKYDNDFDSDSGNYCLIIYFSANIDKVSEQKFKTGIKKRLDNFLYFYQDRFYPTSIKTGLLRLYIEM